MAITRADDATLCLGFNLTLTRAGAMWYNTLRGKQFDSFEELSLAFSNYFIGLKPSPKTAGHLLKIRQRKEESLRDYVHRFQDEAIQVPNLSEETRLLAAIQGLQWDL